MVDVLFHPLFKRKIQKIKDKSLRVKLDKKIEKITDFPEIGKPMRYARKGSREVYVKPFRLSYEYIKEEDVIVFLDLYHKDEQ